MDCTVYRSKTYSLGALAFVLGFAAVVARFMPPTHAPWFMPWTFAALVSIALVALLRTLVTTRWIIRVDEAGIHDARGWTPLIEWGDIVAVERTPKVQRHGNETTHYLRDAWRPLRLTVRHPDKYLLRVQKAARRNFPALVPDPDQTIITIEFMGLAPGSDAVEESIRQHLARLGRPASVPGSPAARA